MKHFRTFYGKEVCYFRWSFCVCCFIPWARSSIFRCVDNLPITDPFRRNFACPFRCIMSPMFEQFNRMRTLNPSVSTLPWGWDFSLFLPTFSYCVLFIFFQGDVTLDTTIGCVISVCLLIFSILSTVSFLRVEQLKYLRMWNPSGCVHGVTYRKPSKILALFP